MMQTRLKGSSSGCLSPSSSTGPSDRRASWQSIKNRIYQHNPQRAHSTRIRCCCTTSDSSVQPSSDQRPAATAAAASPAPTLQLPPPPDTGGTRPQQKWNAVCLAYLGDGVWEACLRSLLYDPVNTRQYNSAVTTLANTHAQAACYDLLIKAQWLSAEETALMRWATNSSSVAPPAHATRQQYKQATAVETLVAHLYLTDTPRLQQLMDWLMQPTQLGQWQQQPQQPQQHNSSKTRAQGLGQRRGSDSGLHKPAGRAKGSHNMQSQQRNTKQGINTGP